MTVKQYVAAIEAGCQFRIHPETVQRQCRQGDLLAQKLRNTWLRRKEILEGSARTYDARLGAKKRPS